MILETPIILNKYTAPKTWSEDNSYMNEFFKNIQRFINDILKFYGRISIKKIYELLGVVFESNDNNDKLINSGPDKQIIFSITNNEDEYVIQIVEV